MTSTFACCTFADSFRLFLSRSLFFNASLSQNFYDYFLCFDTTICFILSFFFFFTFLLPTNTLYYFCAFALNVIKFKRIKRYKKIKRTDWWWFSMCAFFSLSIRSRVLSFIALHWAMNSESIIVEQSTFWVLHFRFGSYSFPVYT